MYLFEGGKQDMPQELRYHSLQVAIDFWVALDYISRSFSPAPTPAHHRPPRQREFHLMRHQPTSASLSGYTWSFQENGEVKRGVEFLVSDFRTWERPFVVVLVGQSIKARG